MSRLTRGELAYLSDTSRNSLVKAAEFKKEAISPEVAKWGKSLLNYGTPVAGGSLAALGARGAGADPTTQVAAFGGGMAVSSPRRWMEIVNNAKAAGKLGKDPFHAGYKEGIKDIALKAGITGGVAVADQGYKVMKNIQDTTANTSKITSDFANQSKPIAGNVVTSLQGMQDTFKDMSDTTRNMSSGINDASSSIRRYLTSPFSVGINNLDLPTKILGGGLALGGGGLLLHHLLKQHEAKKHQAVQ